MDMPPSMPPARSRLALVARRRPASQVIGSWASLPRRAATSKPSPISTPLTAWMLIRACGQQGVELAVPVDVAAEPDRHAVGQDLDDAAERVAVLGRRLDRRRSWPPRPSGSKQRTSEASTARGRRAPGPAASDAATAPMRTTWETTSTPSVRSSSLAQRAGGDPGRGLPGRGPLEHVAGVGEAVLLHAGQVGVTGPGLGQRAARWRPGAGDISSCHLSGSLPLGVGDLDGDRRAERAPVADAAEELHLVLLEAHPRAAAVAQPPAGQLRLDRPRRYRQPRGQALDDHDEGLAVGLTGGQEAEHEPKLPADPSAARCPCYAPPRPGRTPTGVREQHDAARPGAAAGGLGGTPRRRGVSARNEPSDLWEDLQRERSEHPKFEEETSEARLLTRVKALRGRGRCGRGRGRGGAGRRRWPRCSPAPARGRTGTAGSHPGGPRTGRRRPRCRTGRPGSART